LRRVSSWCPGGKPKGGRRLTTIKNKKPSLATRYFRGKALRADVFQQLIPFQNGTEFLHKRIGGKGGFGQEKLRDSSNKSISEENARDLDFFCPL